MRTRQDYYLGPLHVIIRGYTDSPQYGALVWGCASRNPTLDVWVHQTLITLRKR